jgi:carbonic anhydrase/acetyltransferase-like protein (isoleucine patch superfamily)
MNSADRLTASLEVNVLIGTGSIVIDDCYIESGSIIADGAVLLENTHIKGGSIHT